MMMLFFNRIGLARTGVVGPEIGLLLGWSAGSGCGIAALQFLNVALHCKEKRKRKGRRGTSLMTAPMPKSVPGLMREKIDYLESECVCVPFIDGVA